MRKLAEIHRSGWLVDISVITSIKWFLTPQIPTSSELSQQKITSLIFCMLILMSGFSNFDPSQPIANLIFLSMRRSFQYFRVL